MIISFGWTTPALLAGAKTVTRRRWAETHAAHFTEGKLIDAWNTSPRNKAGNPHKVAVIRLTQDAYLEATRDAPMQDYTREGFAHLQVHGLLVDGRPPRALWDQWKASTQILYVVRFEVAEYLEGPLA